MNNEELCKAIQTALDERRIRADAYTDGAFIKVEIEWGDWKHEHLAMLWTVEEVFKSRGYTYWHIEDETETDGSDCYSAIHTFLPIAE